MVQKEFTVVPIPDETNLRLMNKECKMKNKLREKIREVVLG